MSNLLILSVITTPASNNLAIQRTSTIRIVPSFMLPLLSIMLLSTLFCIAAQAADKNDIKGWEKSSKYDQLYNYKEKDSLKGTLVKFEKIKPLPGMAPGTAFTLDEGGEKILVHLCPWSFANPKETGLRKGSKTKVKGCWAMIDGKDVFIAAKVKQGDDFEFKVRLTKDGTPFWTMSPEELEKERKNQ